MKLYVTGDTHCDLDNLIKRIKTNNLNNCILLITGDFGFVWNDSIKENKRLDILSKYLSDRNIKLLTCYGNHENYNIIRNKYELMNYHNGKARMIRDNILFLENGYVFNILDKKIFVMGGAESIDKINRIENISWWKEEIPSYKEFNNGLDNLDKINWKVDYVLTHTCPMKIVNIMYTYHWTNNTVEKYLEEINNKLKFDKWFFGHHHINHTFEVGYFGLYDNVIEMAYNTPDALIINDL